MWFKVTIMFFEEATMRTCDLCWDTRFLFIFCFLMHFKGLFCRERGGDEIRIFWEDLGCSKKFEQKFFQTTYCKLARFLTFTIFDPVKIVSVFCPKFSMTHRYSVKGYASVNAYE